MKKEVGTEKRGGGFLKEQTRFPAMWYMGCRQKAETILACRKYFVVGHRTRRATRKIIHAHVCADKAADRSSLWRHVEPLVKSATFIGLKMTEANPAQTGRIDHLRDGFADLGKYLTH